MAGGGSFEVHVGGTAGVQHQAEGQAAIAAEGEALGFADRLGQGVEPVAEGRPALRRRGTAGSPMVIGSRAWAVGGRQVGREVGQALGQPGDGLGQLAQGPAGEILLVGVVLLQDRQPLQFGVGLGQRQHRRVARGDGLHLGVGQLLAADILGPAGGVVAGHHLAR